MLRQAEFPKSTIDLLHQVKGDDSDDLLAKRLGITRPIISQWRKRGRVAAEGTAKLAELAHIDLMKALAMCAAEEIRTDSYRTKIFKQLSEIPAETTTKENEQILSYNQPVADVAQLVEQLIRNQ